MSENLYDEPRLEPDFAARVLALADRHMTQRRRLRWLVVTSFLCVAASLAILSRSVIVSAPAPTAEKALAIAFPVQPAADIRDSSDDPLFLMFPDAGALARYATEDGDAVDGDAGALFDDEEDFAGGS